MNSWVPQKGGISLLAELEFEVNFDVCPKVVTLLQNFGWKT
jgi:hypothetical protein